MFLIFIGYFLRMQIIKTAHILLVLLLSSIFFAASSYAAEEMVELVVSGDTAQTFAGDCYLQQRTGTLRRHRIKGRVPARFLFPATAFRCNLEKETAKGALVATIIRKGAKEFVQKSRYPFKWVFLQSKGPWGRAKGGVYAARPTFN